LQQCGKHIPAFLVLCQPLLGRVDGAVGRHQG
jgi:hypothetical protein